MKRGRMRYAAAALGALCFLCAFARPLTPLLGGLLRQTALFSAAAAMPEGAVGLLRERYTQELYAAPSTEVAPRPAPGSSYSPPSEGLEAEPAPATLIPPAPVLPEIPPAYRGRVVTSDLSKGGSDAFSWKAARVKNASGLGENVLKKALDTPDALSGSAPQVLIFHTHATEGYSPYDSAVFDTRNGWRTRDNRQNTVAVGATLAAALRERGLKVLHDTTQHDHPSYNGAYERSRVTVEEYLKNEPGIRVAIDLHRDALFPSDTEMLKPTAVVDGRAAAQLMLIACCDDGSGTLPDWRENLRFAAGFADAIERRTPGLCRPILCAPRHYNQDLLPGMLLLEVGSNANTLEEALYSAELAAAALADYLLEADERLLLAPD